jgi:CRISPR-associated endonuclease Csn1
VGWAVMKDDYSLVSKKCKVYGGVDKKKNFWGVSLFEEGNVAADRRLKRGMRRRLKRRRERINYLQNIFAEEVSKIDENFFHRLDESFLQLEDKKVQVKYPLFREEKLEKEYYEKYPTIYHLRKHLADSKEKADIREVYLAMHHILKYRGHFTNQGQTIDPRNVDIRTSYEEFKEEFKRIGALGELSDEDFINIVMDKDKSKSAKAYAITERSKLEKTDKKRVECVAKLIVGNLGNLKDLFLDVTTGEIPLFEEKDSEKLKLSDSDKLEEKFAALEQILTEEQMLLLYAVKKVYDDVLLNDIISTEDKHTNAPLSASMVEKYDLHKRQLQELKKIVKNNLADEFGMIFREQDEKINNYYKYVNGSGKSKNVKATQEEFYQFLIGNTTKKGILNNNSEIETKPAFTEIKEAIDKETYLQKQRMFKNGAIPYQVHEVELKAIIENQSKYYSFLADMYENVDIDSEGNEINKQELKIVGLFKFRIPYYVGPLAKHKAHSANAWIEKTEENITPWNFGRVVDKDKSAINFIERMTLNDTYIPSEKVLPRNSLLYQTYTVYNELTKVRIDGKLISTDMKRDAFELFKKLKTVKVEDFKNMLDKCGYYRKDDIKILRLDGFDKKFNAHLSTYHDLKSVGFTDMELNDLDLQEAFEEIIKWQTIFEDNKILLKTIKKAYADILSEEKIKKLAKKHYTGWGRLSKKLISGIRDKDSSKTILDFLKDDGLANRNLMQLINDENLSFKNILKTELLGSESTSKLSYGLVKDLAGSPALKKGIWQSLKVVKEVEEIMGYAPANVVIEFARENQNTSNTARAKSTIEKALKELEDSKVALDELREKEHKAFSNEKIRLYFLQNGKCMYTGKPLELDKLSAYEVDHIYPQSLTKDNSWDNKVLVRREANQEKKDRLPGELYAIKMNEFWKKLEKVNM